jgi:hypothetical protein
MEGGAMLADKLSSGKSQETLFFKVFAEYARQREEAGVPLDQYPFFLDEEGLSRLPKETREKAQAWLSKNRR